MASRQVSGQRYLTNPKRDIQGWNKVFGEYFPVNPPALLCDTAARVYHVPLPG